LLNTLSTEVDVHGVQKVLSKTQTMASEWQTAFVVSHKMPWCALLTAVKIYNKRLENCKTFSSRPRPRPNVQDQNQDGIVY